MYYGDPNLRAALPHLTTDQIRLSWVREQHYNRDHGLPFFDRLVDPVTDEVLATA